MPAADPAELAAFFAELDRDHVPHLSVNGVIFGARGGALEVLLTRWTASDVWGLPGGYVRRDEGVDDAAARMLRESVGLDGAFLRQFHTFGAPGRTAAMAAEASRGFGVELPAGHWVRERVVSVGYVALVDAARARVAARAPALEHRWWPAAECPPLILDHGAMVERALAAVRERLDGLPLGASLLPGAFTMPELQRVYEAVLGRALDRRNFQKRTLELGLVSRLPEQRTGGPHRPAYLYRWVGRDGAGAGA